MSFSADPLSLTTRLGKIVVISAPDDQGLNRLDWGGWIANISLYFTQFRSPASRKIYLLDNNIGNKDRKIGTSLEYARQDMQTADLLNLIGGWTENTLMLGLGSWTYSLSSWIESLKAIAHSNYSANINQFFEQQMELWRKLEGEFADDSLFVLSDGGNRFSNAGELCKSWLRRVLRSRIAQDLHSGGWACCVLSILPEGVHDQGRVRIHRLISLDSSVWCGDPEWQSNLPTMIIAQLSKCSEFWISVPSNVLVQDLNYRLSVATDSSSIKVIAPSVVLGWHPVRDFSLFLGSKAEKRAFLFMDSHERLQLMIAETLGGQDGAT